jgi:uncharacterized phage-associated protein
MCQELFNVQSTSCPKSKNNIKKKYLRGEALSPEEICQTMENYGMCNSAQFSDIFYEEDPWKTTPEKGIISKNAMEKYSGSLNEEPRKKLKKTESG